MKSVAYFILGVVLYLGVAEGVTGGFGVPRFEDYGVYTIQNKARSKELLTFVNESVMVPPEMQFAGASVPGSQRWRLDKSALFTAFELRPTLNENFVLEYVPDQGVLRWFAAWGNTKLWYLEHAGDDYTLIKHKRYGVCLEALESNVTVVARECNGDQHQQWLIQL